MFYYLVRYRFITEDTFGGVLSSPITLNRYAYAGQNPANYKDPSGHFFTVIQQVLTLTLQEMIKDKEGTECFDKRIFCQAFFLLIS